MFVKYWRQYKKVFGKKRVIKQIPKLLIVQKISKIQLFKKKKSTSAIKLFC